MGNSTKVIIKGKTKRSNHLLKMNSRKDWVTMPLFNAE